MTGRPLFEVTSTKDGGTIPPSFSNGHLLSGKSSVALTKRFRERARYMPRRTNQFQSLISRIHAALHGKNAKVEESAMIRNYFTEKDTEVDVLVSFELGGTTYRTAIECRDWAKKAGPDWIRDLATKRDECRLDKMIAVHSKGFTQPALTQAKKHRVEAITVAETSDVDWSREVLPFQHVAIRAASCRFPNGLVFAVDGPQPGACDFSNSRIVFAEDLEQRVRDFITEIGKLIREWYLRKLVSLDQGPPSASEEKHITVDVVVHFAPETTLRVADGGVYALREAHEAAEVEIHTVLFDPLERMTMRDDVHAVDTSTEWKGRRMQVTLTEHRGQVGMCLVGQDMKFANAPDKKRRLGKHIHIYLSERAGNA